MRPSMWSDYGPPAQKRTRSSIAPKILLAAVVVVAGVTGITGIYPQIIDSEWVQDSVPHPPKIASLDAMTPRRSGIVAAIPLPPRRAAMTTGEAAVSTPRPAPPAPSPTEMLTSVAVVEPPPAETAPSLGIADIPDAEAKVDAPADPARVAVAKPVGRSVARAPARAPVVKKRVVRTEHRRGYSGAYAQWGGGSWGGFSPFGNFRGF